MADKKTPILMGDVTPATAILIQRATGRKKAPVRRKRRAKKTASRRRSTARKKRPARAKGRLKKGSPAAKRHMARLRAMKKKRRRR